MTTSHLMIMLYLCVDIMLAAPDMLGQTRSAQWRAPTLAARTKNRGYRRRHPEKKKTRRLAIRGNYWRGLLGIASGSFYSFSTPVIIGFDFHTRDDKTMKRVGGATILYTASGDSSSVVFEPGYGAEIHIPVTDKFQLAFGGRGNVAIAQTRIAATIYRPEAISQTHFSLGLTPHASFNFRRKRVVVGFETRVPIYFANFSTSGPMFAVNGSMPIYVLGYIGKRF